MIMRKLDYKFKLGQSIVIECQIYGSKPTAHVRWFIGQREVSSLDSGRRLSQVDRDIISSGQNLTTLSYLTLTPQLSDNQQPLTCSAHNPKLGSASGQQQLSDSMQMNVECK